MALGICDNYEILLTLPASSEFCGLLITFANSLDPDQNVGPDLDWNCLTLLLFS